MGTDIGILEIILLLLCLIVVLAVVATGCSIDSSYSSFCRVPAHIHTDKAQYDGYTRMLMKFSRWRRLFELDPTNFWFISPNGAVMQLTRDNTAFETTHPAYYDDTTTTVYWITFSFIDYVKYWLYRKQIREKISSLSEDIITKRITGGIQDKLDKIIEESQVQIDRSLNLQKEIVLRIQEDNKK